MSIPTVSLHVAGTHAHPLTSHPQQGRRGRGKQGAPPASWSSLCIVSLTVHGAQAGHAGLEPTAVLTRL